MSAQREGRIRIMDDRDHGQVRLAPRCREPCQGPSNRISGQNKEERPCEHS
jgi:hypothetical protein